jgi:putative transposase
MGRKPRVVVAGAPHHVYLRGNNRRVLFSSRADRILFLACLRRALDATKCQLHQLTLMTNHVHAIITPPDKKALSQLVKRTCQRYAQLRNAKRGGSGKLFEERYRNKVIVDEAQLRVTTLYNDANAFRAKAVREPFAHEWSTAPLHAATPGGRMLRSVWTPSSWYTRLGPTPSKRAEAYRAAMVEYLELEEAAPIDEEVEEVDDEGYERRLERPDRSSAREAFLRYGRKVKKAG